jgi:Dehydrogenases with different specificities (related to short-chain alcohol dehydrogenases)
VITLENKIAIVTGAAHGIGRAIADMFVDAGARVVIADIDVEAGRAAVAALNERRSGSIFVRADVSVAADVEALVASAAGIAGRLDVLCNNAAYLGPAHAVGEADDEEWEQSFRVSLLGAQRVIAAVLPYMVRQQGGSIINISSVQGLVGARNSAAYTSMKHALIGLTRSVAYDYGPQNVRANAICPGAIQTRISPKPGEELYRRQLNKTFLGRVGMPSEVAYAALFLASDAASYVTGAALPVDGGWTAM